MDRRNQPADYWGQSMTFWCRLWQVQFEQYLRFWAAWAERLPHQSAAELAAEAEAMKSATEPERRQPRAKRPAATARAAKAETAKRVH